MDEKVLYQSETPKWKFTVARFAILAFLLIIALFEYLILSIGHFHPDSSILMLAVAIAVVLTIPVLFLIKYIRTTKHDLIVYNNRMILIAEEVLFINIKNIEHNVRVKLLWALPEQHVIISLHDGSRFTINPYKYSNGHLFRQLCEKIQANIEKGIFVLNDYKPFELPEITTPFEDLRNEDFKRHLGKPILPLLMCVAALMLLGLGSPLLTKNSPHAIGLFVFAVGAATLFLASRLFRYLLISPDYLVIRSYLYANEKSVFRMDDILYFRLLGGGKINTLFIMTKDYKLYKRFISPPSWDDDTEDVVNEYIQKNKP